MTRYCYQFDGYIVCGFHYTQICLIGHCSGQPLLHCSGFWFSVGILLKAKNDRKSESTLALSQTTVNSLWVASEPESSESLLILELESDFSRPWKGSPLNITFEESIIFLSEIISTLNTSMSSQLRIRKLWPQEWNLVLVSSEYTHLAHPKAFMCLRRGFSRLAFGVESMKI